MNHHRAQKLLARAALAKPVDWTKLEPHLAGCSLCRCRYEQIRTVETVLAGPTSQAIAPISLERIEARLREKVRGTPKTRSTRWLVPAAMALCTALLAVFFLRNAGLGEEEVIRPRGSATTATAGLPLTLSIYCIRPIEGAPAAVPGPCRPTDRLQAAYKSKFALTLESLRAVAPDGTRRQLADEVRLPKAKTTRPLPVELAPPLVPGRWQLEAVLRTASGDRLLVGQTVEVQGQP